MKDADADVDADATTTVDVDAEILVDSSVETAVVYGLS